jgi:uncharacterized protein (DUF302 family)
METRRYGLFIRTQFTYEEALRRMKDALKAQGFGVLTEIDVQATMKEKLGIDFRHYDIIGACNPPLAHQALSTETDIGLLLPCNVIVYEDNDGTTIGALDPSMMMDVAGNSDLGAVAERARQKLLNALETMEAEA